MKKIDIHQAKEMLESASPEDFEEVISTLKDSQVASLIRPYLEDALEALKPDTHAVHTHLQTANNVLREVGEIFILLCQKDDPEHDNEYLAVLGTFKSRNLAMNFVMTGQIEKQDIWDFYGCHRDDWVQNWSEHLILAGPYPNGYPLPNPDYLAF